VRPLRRGETDHRYGYRPAVWPVQLDRSAEPGAPPDPGAPADPGHPEAPDQPAVCARGVSPGREVHGKPVRNLPALRHVVRVALVPPRPDYAELSPSEPLSVRFGQNGGTDAVASTLRRSSDYTERGRRLWLGHGRFAHIGDRRCTG
jgi:hypothetical protein